MILKKVVYIIGPTASGKTALSLHLADRFDGEIINTDAFSFYKNADILTAKPTKEERLTPHHMLDFLELHEESYNIFEFQKAFVETIDRIHSKNKLPIVVGGSNLYVEASLFETSSSSLSEEERSSVSKMSLPEFLDFLQKKNDPRIFSIHPKDTKRLKRLFESFIEENRLSYDYSNCRFGDVIFLALECNSVTLVKSLIENRCRGMFFESDGLKEVVKVLSHFFDSEQSEEVLDKKSKGILSAIGYIEMLPLYKYLVGNELVKSTQSNLCNSLQNNSELRTVFEKCLKELESATLRLHKSQKKWIKNRLYPRFSNHWKNFLIDDSELANKISGIKSSAVGEVERFLNAPVHSSINSGFIKSDNKLWTCEECNVTCGLLSQARHLSSRGHRARVKKRKKENKKPLKIE